MFFGYDIEKLLLLLVVAALLIGPERLPRYAEGLAKVTKLGREWLAGARTRVKEEMGDDFDDVEWRKLDPRQYDPRRIIRDALLDDAPVPTVTAVSVASAALPAGATTIRIAGFDPDAAVPFDSEAT
ncbi:Sec-independent protein translocase TatB [Microbacterium dextranolyticum]|uniref:Translocase n=1 Tax=Microbacterium dextranolyticum TaxID=36806 RepID=A0A9W6M685_9MICO|nr:Sec-independent protein translocase TatB [Microbacterium dextranolyticum]MBM7463284.1 sec-independent protein translocase protein TatB [Microbacterium dextranolyticum]GLJ95611.1 translocase [Microbacterium dextranolyticum]